MSLSSKPKHQVWTMIAVGFLNSWTWFHSDATGALCAALISVAFLVKQDALASWCREGLEEARDILRRNGL